MTGPQLPFGSKMHWKPRAPPVHDRKSFARYAASLNDLFLLLVPDNLQAGIVVHAYGCKRTGDRHSEHGPFHVGRTVIRSLVDVGGDQPGGNHLVALQYLCPLLAVLLEFQMNPSQRPRHTDKTEGIKNQGAGFVVGDAWVELAGVEVQNQALGVFPGERAAGDGPKNVGDGETAEVGGLLEGCVRQAGVAPGSGAEAT